MSDQSDQVDLHYYEVAKPASLGEKLVIVARNAIYADFLRLTGAVPESTILDVGVSDVVGEAANVLERNYPHLDKVTAVGLGSATEFQAAFPQVAYRQIAPGERLPFADKSFDICASNAVLEHVGSEEAQSRFIAELTRVARCTFITVPNRFFPIEHHTAIPFLHWTDLTFAAACYAFGKGKWTDPANLIMMTKKRLRSLSPCAGRIGFTGIRVGPFSSNLFLLLGGAEREQEQ